MHVELSPEAKERVESLVASGAYESPESVIDAALDEFLTPTRRFTAEELGPLFARGRESIAKGATVPADAALVAELRGIVDAKARRSSQS